MNKSTSENLIHLGRLSGREPHSFDVQPDAKGLEGLNRALGTQSLRKVRFQGALTAVGSKDWTLNGKLGATVVQECVVTLAPVTTRIEEKVVRVYVAGYEAPEASEFEMDEDDTVEALPTEIDLIAILAEALSLALPPYPKSPGAELPETVITEDGISPLTDSEMKPFSGLAGLRDKLTQGDQ